MVGPTYLLFEDFKFKRDYNMYYNVGIQTYRTLLCSLLDVGAYYYEIDSYLKDSYLKIITLFLNHIIPSNSMNCLGCVNLVGPFFTLSSFILMILIRYVMNVLSEERIGILIVRLYIVFFYRTLKICCFNYLSTGVI